MLLEKQAFPKSEAYKVFDSSVFCESKHLKQYRINTVMQDTLHTAPCVFLHCYSELNSCA